MIVSLWGSNPAAISERKVHSLSAVSMGHDFMDNIFSPAVDKDCIADFVCICRLIWSPGDCHDASLSVDDEGAGGGVTPAGGSCTDPDLLFVILR